MRGLSAPQHATLRHPWEAVPRQARLEAARVVGVTGITVYNWWIVAPFQHGVMTSTNGFFSDLSATGQPRATLLQHLDLTAGLLLLLAVLLRASVGDVGKRGEWTWLLVFASSATIGAHYPYACAEGLSAACRSAEYSLQLPAHHYLHMLSGITEFGSITWVGVLAWRRTRDQHTLESGVYRTVIAAFLVSYPLLAVAYLGDRGGILIEPVFFLTFTTIVLTELFASPDGPRHRSRPRRVATTGRVERAGDAGEDHPDATPPGTTIDLRFRPRPHTDSEAHPDLRSKGRPDT